MAGVYSGPSARGMARRLVRVGREALALSESDPVRALGLQWYPLARAWLETLAQRYAPWGATLESVAGACAALSPQVSWLDQTRFLPGFLESVLVERDTTTLPHPGFLRNRARAARILLGESPESVLGGPKVTAFYACILGDAERVCVDRHAATVALGERTPRLSARLVLEIQRAYALAARVLGIGARDLQSMLWCHYKASGAASAQEAPTFFEGREPALSIVDLALGWHADPALAFHAPAESMPAPAPDDAAPLLPHERAETAPLPF